MAFGKDNDGISGDRLASKVKAKRRLIEDRFPGFFDQALKDAIDVGQFDESSIHRVNLGDDKVGISFTDGSSCEISAAKEKIFVYGKDSAAKKFSDLAAELYFPWGANVGAVQEVESMGRASGKKPRLEVVQAGNAKKDAAPAKEPKSFDTQTYRLDHVANSWRSDGFRNVNHDDHAIWVALDRRRKLKDVGGSVEIYGRGKERNIAKALIRKALADWDGVIRIEGSQKLKELCWLEAQRRGASIVDFEPSPQLVSRWNLEERLRSRLPKRELASIEHTASASDGRTPVAEAVNVADEQVEAPVVSQLVESAVPATEQQKPTAPVKSSLDIFNSIKPMHEALPSLFERDSTDDPTPAV